MPQKFDHEQITDAIRIMFPDPCVVEIRSPKAAKNGTISGYFELPQNTNKMVRAIEEISGDFNVYWTINPVNPDLLARANNCIKPFTPNGGTTDDQNILHRNWLAFDFDPVRVAGISSTDAEKQAARKLAIAVRKWLRDEMHWPDSLIADSGNGYHALLRINLPNDDESRDLLKAVLESTARKFDNTAVKIDTKLFNASRILKCYGSMAVKGDSTADRPHRLAQMFAPPASIQFVSKEQLQAVAALLPPPEKKKKKKAGAKNDEGGGCTDEMVESGLSAAGIDFKGPLSYKGGSKYQHACFNNPEHQSPDAFTMRDKDGWVSEKCSHNTCGDGLNQSEWFVKIEELAGHEVEKPLRKKIDVRELLASLGAENADEPIPTLENYDASIVRCHEEIDSIMRLPEKPDDDGWMPKREKHRWICQLVLRHMQQYGKLWNCGNVVTYVPSLTRKIVPVVRGGQEFLSLMAGYGLYAADPVTAAVGKHLDAMCRGFERNTVRLLSFYDRPTHTLYANEYAGNFLRITSDKVERLRNGDDGMLFDWGEEKCDPLECAFPVPPVPALSLNGLIQRTILDTVEYAPSGIGKENATLLLTAAILAIYFPERLNHAMPLPTFTGPGGSMKTAMAKQVGKLIQGRCFQVTAAPEGPGAIQEIKNNAISYPFVVLDEANKLKGLSSILKVIATGGKDTRRTLYTTSSMEEKDYQARMWMTMNTGDPNEETVASRMLIIDVGARQEARAYRATFYLDWSNEQRNQLWTELVGRLSSVMRDLAQADEAGDGDLRISHRMADFMVFGLTLAKQEGREEEFQQAMEAMANRQETAVSDAIEVVDLLDQIPASRYKGKELTAKEWGKVFLGLAPTDTKLRDKLNSKNVMAWWFKSNQNLLGKRYGMATRLDKHHNLTFYSFTNLRVGVSEVPFTDNFGMDAQEEEERREKTKTVN